MESTTYEIQDTGSCGASVSFRQPMGQNAQSTGETKGSCVQRIHSIHDFSRNAHDWKGITESA